MCVIRIHWSDLPLSIRDRSRVRESRKHGSVRGVPGNGYPYRDRDGALCRVPRMDRGDPQGPEPQAQAWGRVLLRCAKTDAGTTLVWFRLVRVRLRHITLTTTKVTPGRTMRQSTHLISLTLFACLAANAQTLDAPASVQAGAKFGVTWSGTDTARDYVAIAKQGAPKASYISYQYLSKGQTLEMEAPEAAGVYELRWVEGKTRAIVVTRPLTVTAVTITLNAPSSVDLGGEVEVQWSGTVNPRDFITIVDADAREGRYTTYIYTRGNTQGQLRAPEKPGQYEVRYLSARKYLTLSKVPLAVVGAEASVTIPSQVTAGAPFEISWTGPNNPRDYLTIVEAGAKEGTYKSYVFTSKGNPVTMRAPDKPGRYEVRYLTA